MARTTPELPDAGNWRGRRIRDGRLDPAANISKSKNPADYKIVAKC